MPLRQKVELNDHSTMFSSTRFQFYSNLGDKDKDNLTGSEGPGAVVYICDANLCSPIPICYGGVAVSVICGTTPNGAYTYLCLCCCWSLSLAPALENAKVIIENSLYFSSLLFHL